MTEASFHLNEPKRPLPRPGTIAGNLIEFWKDCGGRITYDEAHACYHQLQVDRWGVGTSACPRDRGWMCHVGMNLTRLLKKHGYKDGKPGSRAPWIYGKRPSSEGPSLDEVMGLRKNVTTVSDAPRVSPELLRELNLAGTPPPEGEELHMRSLDPPAMAPMCDPADFSPTSRELAEEITRTEARLVQMKKDLEDSIMMDRWRVWARERLKHITNKHALLALVDEAQKRLRSL